MKRGRWYPTTAVVTGGAGGGSGGGGDDSDASGQGAAGADGAAVAAWGALLVAPRAPVAARGRLCEGSWSGCPSQGAAVLVAAPAGIGHEACGVMRRRGGGGARVLTLAAEEAAYLVDRGFLCIAGCDDGALLLPREWPGADVAAAAADDDDVPPAAAAGIDAGVDVVMVPSALTADVAEAVKAPAHASCDGVPLGGGRDVATCGGGGGGGGGGDGDVAMHHVGGGEPAMAHNDDATMSHGGDAGPRRGPRRARGPPVTRDAALEASLARALTALLARAGRAPFVVYRDLRGRGFVVYRHGALNGGGGGGGSSQKRGSGGGGVRCASGDGVCACDEDAVGAAVARCLAGSLVFDVWTPPEGTPFRKSAPGPPDSYVVVVDAVAGGEVPRVGAIDRARGLLGAAPLAPLRFAFVSGATVVYLSAARADVLPVLDG
jgi:hypothetical protein